MSKKKSDKDNFQDFEFDTNDIVNSALWFLKVDKGKDVDTIPGLKKTREWVRTADPDDLMLGDPTGDSFDIMMGSVRRGMLLDAIDYRITKMKKNSQ